MQWLEKKRIDWMESSLAGLDKLARRRGKAVQPAHLATGIAGEDAAYFYLRRKGYTIVARRWSAGNLPGDLDLIAWQSELLCFIEVKTRTARDESPAEIAVDEHKRSVLRRLARAYLRQLPGEKMPQVRFDMVSVYLVADRATEIAHFEDAFAWQERRGGHE
jgi:putative endonuclease